MPFFMKNLDRPSKDKVGVTGSDKEPQSLRPSVIVGAFWAFVVVLFLTYGHKYDSVGDMLVRTGTLSLFVLLITFVTGVYLWKLYGGEHLTPLKVTFLGLLTAFIVLSVRLLIWRGMPLSLSPIILTSMMLALTYSQETALTVLLLHAGVIGLVTGGNFTEAVVLVPGATVGILGMVPIRNRSKLIKIGMLAGIVNIVAYVGIVLAGGLAAADWNSLQRGAFWALANGIATGFLMTGILPFVERIFNVATEMTLLELSDQNQPALRKLALEAPGTYHHSLTLASLAEAAANTIDSQPLLARVGAYYHDIGKCSKPTYFSENESIPGSKHKKLTPTVSAMIIIAHVKDGLEMARHYGLPNAVRDIVAQHHGTSLVEYFYREAKQKTGEDGSRSVSEHIFRYPGPRPQTKEAGIIMLADAVEAASRALDEPSPSRLESLVREVVDRKLADGQLDECPLNLREVRTLEASFIRGLNAIFHGRVKYPEEENPDDAEETGQGQDGGEHKGRGND
jgi:putative nucleotidyltransferase with HDIG domain